jgi:hypothetical protein
MPYPKKTWESLEKPAFEILGGEGESMDNPYQIGEGFLFSTFSLGIETRVPVYGLGKTFDLEPNYKFYIEVDVDSNLQPINAEIKCTEVNTDDNWKYYPFNSLIEPEFTTDEEREKFELFAWEGGRILKLLNGRQQRKLYILIGYRADDSNKNGNSEKSLDENNTPVQILRENIILLK